LSILCISQSDIRYLHWVPRKPSDSQKQTNSSQFKARQFKPIQANSRQGKSRQVKASQGKSRQVESSRAVDPPSRFLVIHPASMIGWRYILHPSPLDEWGMVLLVDRSDHEMIWLPDGDGRWGPRSREVYDSQSEIEANVRLESSWIPSC
jgi:hypothetical protein